MSKSKNIFCDGKKSMMVVKIFIAQIIFIMCLVLISGFGVISINFAILIIAIIDLVLFKLMQKERFENSLNSEKIFFKLLKNVFTHILVAIIVLLVFYVQIFVLNAFTNKIIEINILKYLNKKYGECDFKIVRVEKDYSYYSGGILNSDHTGYELVGSSKLMNDNFKIYLCTTQFLTISRNDVYDSFIEKYYRQKVNEYFENEVGFECYMSFIGDIDNDFGHIPTIDELLDYNIDFGMRISVQITYNQIEYARKITVGLIHCFENNNNIDYHLFYRKLGSYDITFNKKLIKIKQGNDVVETIDLKE